MKSILIESAKARSGQRIVFEQVDDDGVRYGPFVEQRTMGEDLEAFMAGHAASLDQELKAEPVKPEDELLRIVLGHDEVTIKAALAIDDVKLSALRGKVDGVVKIDAVIAVKT